MCSAIHSVECDDGYLLRYRVWPAADPAGTLVLLNGAISHSGWFGTLAELLVKSSLSIVGADRRGSGLNAAGRGDLPSRTLLVSDVCRIIAAEGHQGAVYLAGWSWGALPAINVALELGDRLQGLVLLAPGLFIPPAIKERTQREFAVHPDAAEDSPVLRSALTPEMFSARSDVCQFIRDDPLCQRLFTPRFFRVTQEMSLIAATRLSQLKQRLLLLLAGQDQTADNERTVKAVGRLPGSAVTVATLDCHHGMHFEMPHEMAAHISAWIGRRPAHQ